MTNHQSDFGASLEREDGQSSDETASDLKDLVLTPAAPMDDLVAEQGPAFKASAIDSHMDPPESIESKGLLADNEAALTQANADKAEAEAMANTLKHDCNWVESHFDSRRTKRKAEMDGLVEAKNYLAGVEDGLH